MATRFKSLGQVDQEIFDSLPKDKADKLRGMIEQRRKEEDASFPLKQLYTARRRIKFTLGIGQGPL